MIVSAHAYVRPTIWIRADICIVGAGAAGITLACELDGSGLKIIVLEAGGLKPVGSEVDSYGGVATAPHPDPTQFRRITFGGTTSLWGGRCIPLDPLDFKRRPYVSNSGWPIRYEEVAKHYSRALDYCDAGRFDFTATGSLRVPSPDDRRIRRTEVRSLRISLKGTACRPISGGNSRTSSLNRAM